MVFTASFMTPIVPCLTITAHSITNHDITLAKHTDL